MGIVCERRLLGVASINRLKLLSSFDFKEAVFCPYLYCTQIFQVKITVIAQLFTCVNGFRRGSRILES